MRPVGPPTPRAADRAQLDGDVVGRAAVLGQPISHSLSPVMHRAAYDELRLPWRYGAYEVSEDQLQEFIVGLGPEWVGLSLTMPLKRCIIPLLDGADAVAERLGVVNTVVFTGEHRVGFNTDVTGIVLALREVLASQPRTASVLGAGATAASALAGLSELNVRDVQLSARRPEAAQAMRPVAESVDIDLEVVPWDQRRSLFSGDVLISTLPADAAKDLATRVPVGVATLLDVSYRPHPTRLAAAWAAAGGTVAPGHRMLLWQAAAQVELMTGLQPPVAAMSVALERELIGSD